MKFQCGLFPFPFPFFPFPFKAPMSMGAEAPPWKVAFAEVCATGFMKSRERCYSKITSRTWA